VAALGYALVSVMGEPRGLAAVAVASVFVALGAVEGCVVGVFQSRVLQKHGVVIKGWLRATIVGAVVAWAVGMVPSTIMNLVESGASNAPPLEIPQWQRLVFASALGAVAGPVLAYFQWRALRQCIARGALWWLPGNSAAWALGMPIVFLGIHLAVNSSLPIVAAIWSGAALLSAGAVVGAVHGVVMIWLINSDGCKDSVA
jgi:hypothetical protein